MSNKLIIILSIITILFVSCVNKDDITGKWNITNIKVSDKKETLDEKSSYFEMTADGFMNIRINGEKARGKWELDRHEKKIRMYIFDSDEIRGRYTIENNVLKITGRVDNERIYMELTKKNKGKGDNNKLIKYTGFINNKYAITMYLNKNCEGYYYYNKKQKHIKIKGKKVNNKYVLNCYIDGKLNDILEFSKKGNSLGGYWYNKDKTKKLSFKAKTIN